ncbi:MAG: hypothetical protein IK075_05485 [Prevotella sp.]|nr:hypothetical protein [Prevotella sp.]
MGTYNRAILIAILSVLTSAVSAQTEVEGSKTLPTDSLRLDMTTPMNDSLLMERDSALRYRPIQPMNETDAAIKLDIDPSLYDNRRGSWEVNTIQGGKLFTPWRGSAVVVSGGADSMPGLLDRESGALTLYQNVGRWNFSASALADKYRFVGMGFLQTRYGVGGTVGYQVNDFLSLHAFGYYYGNSSMISPAVNPYLATTNFGGYADIRLHKNFGVDAGVRRYLNPMTGRWVTDPIVSPYIKFNNGQKFGFDFGNILKGLIWGNQDKMMPRGPVRMPPPSQQRQR